MVATYKKFDVPMLNSMLDNITREAGLVFWMRTLDFQKQLYVSPNYANLWGISCDALYQHPQSWMETLIEEDRERLFQQFQKRRKDVVSKPTDPNEDTLLFRVSRKNTDNQVLYIRDKAFTLVDKRRQPIAVGGVGIPLEKSQWIALNSGKLDTSPLEKGFFLLINEMLKLSSQPLSTFFNDNSITIQKNIVYFKDCAYELTSREAQCLFYSVHGYSAKEAAKFLKLSPRTIETYLENIKNKLYCRNKLELIGNVDISLLSASSLQLITP